jgi:TetR/AcrR family transcriptional regulator
MTRLKATAKKSKPGPRGNPEATKNAILDAALAEFAAEGAAGARTDAIACAAGVNKALLYYYYEDKETLYGAVLDHVFSRVSAAIDGALSLELPPREKILAVAGAHFDVISQSPAFPRLVQREMMRAGRAGSPHLTRLAQSYMKPGQLRIAGLLQQGIASGDFRPVDPLHFVLSMVALNVFYFSSAPVVAYITQTDPLSPEMIARRRKAVLDLLAAGLFTERTHEEKSR